MPDLTGLSLHRPQDDAVDLLLQVRLEPGATELSGGLYGPRCAHARTLPTDFSLRAIDCAEGEPRDADWLLTARVLEPCYWTPELPFLYEATINWRDAGGHLRTTQRTIGLVRIGARGRSIYRDSKRIVLRGVSVAQIDEAAIAEARTHQLALFTPDPGDPACDWADEQGVVIAADLRGMEHPIERASQLRRRPSVAFVLVGDEILAAENGDASTFCAARPELGNSLIAVAWQSNLAAQGDVVVWEASAGDAPPDLLLDSAKPVLAIRTGQPYADFRQARRFCDQLQAELAPMADLAGYFVGE